MLHAAQALILGLIEGITEFLPVSSTGHLILAAQAMHITETDFVKSFQIIIQLGAILAVFLIYWKRLLLNKKIFMRVLVAFLPTAIIGLTLYKYVKAYLLGSTAVVIWALLLGGVVLIIFERLRGSKPALITDLENISYGKALLIGLFQSIALVPGVSRSAATIVGGLMLGVSRSAIVEFSFMLAIPTMAAATLLDIIKSGPILSQGGLGVIALGFVAAFISAFFAIRFLLRYIKTHSFAPFGIYRIVIALIFIIFI